MASSAMLRCQKDKLLTRYKHEDQWIGTMERNKGCEVSKLKLNAGYLSVCTYSELLSNSW